MTVSYWLEQTAKQFARAHIPTARLDAELLLCHMLAVDRAWLVAHDKESLARAALNNPKGTRPGGIKDYGDKLILRRLSREPMAYLLGRKEFYGREFIVNKHVLVPRPETEMIIELAKKHGLSGRILDVGCGSGAIGLTLAQELEGATITLSDISPEALEVAQKNAKTLKTKGVDFIESNLLEYWEDSPHAFDSIVANLPYVDRSWERSPETRHEPSVALFAVNGGLALIYKLIEQATHLLAPSGYLLLEADPEQHESIIVKSKNHGFGLIESRDYAVLLKR